MLHTYTCQELNIPTDSIQQIFYITHIPVTNTAVPMSEYTKNIHTTYLPFTNTAFRLEVYTKYLYTTHIPVTNTAFPLRKYTLLYTTCVHHLYTPHITSTCHEHSVFSVRAPRIYTKYIYIPVTNTAFPLRELRDTTRRQTIEHDVFPFKGPFEFRTAFTRHHKFLCACVCVCVRERELEEGAHLFFLIISSNPSGIAPFPYLLK